MLILVAHGSRDSKWRASVERLTESLQADVGPDKVRLAYMDHTPPTLDDVVSEAVQRGVARVRVLPLFLANEGHVDRDIRPVVERLRGVHRSVDIEQLPALAEHRSFREFLAKIALEEPGSNT
jgi:sirohydrochlorin cobaltochelatase